MLGRGHTQGMIPNETKPYFEKGTSQLLGCGIQTTSWQTKNRDITDMWGCWYILGAGFNYLLFSPRSPWDNDAIRRAYLSNGLVQPPPSIELLGIIWVFPKIGVPQNEWFVMENPINPWMIWGEFSHYFWITSIYRLLTWQSPNSPTTSVTLFQRPTTSTSGSAPFRSRSYTQGVLTYLLMATRNPAKLTSWGVGSWNPSIYKVLAPSKRWLALGFCPSFYLF